MVGSESDRDLDNQAGVAVTDILTGHYAHSAVLAALFKRYRTGMGSHVECSLFESQVSKLKAFVTDHSSFAKAVR